MAPDNASVNMAAGGGGREKEALKMPSHPQLHGHKLESHRAPRITTWHF